MSSQAFEIPAAIQRKGLLAFTNKTFGTELTDERAAIGVIEKAVNAAQGRPACCPSCLEGGSSSGHFACSAVNAVELVLYEANLINPFFDGTWTWA
jgi:hypothetical protein